MAQPVTFIHAPKCGGTSIGSALRARYFYSQATVSLAQSEALQKLLWPEAQGLDRFYREFEIRDMMMAQLVMKRVRCISAHARFNPAIRANAPDRRRYITVLREPVSRFVSHYLYLKRRHPSSVEGDSFDEFLSTDQAGRFGSEYLFYFAGRYQVNEPDLGGLIRSACSNLESFDVIGDTARMDQFRADVEQLLGVRLLNLKRNTRPEGAGIELSPAQRQRVQEICAPDLSIYDTAISGKTACV